MDFSSIQAVQSRVTALRGTLHAMSGQRPPVAALGTPQATTATEGTTPDGATSTGTAATNGAGPVSRVSLAQRIAAQKADAATAPTGDATSARRPALTADAAAFAQRIDEAIAKAKNPEEDWPAVSDAVKKWTATLKLAGKQHGIDAKVLAAVMQVESNGDPFARSSAGAQGIMQFMPATARELGVDPMDPTSAIHGAAKLLKKHLTTFGSLDKALAAYNAGPGAVRRYGGVPPFSETQHYVKAVNDLLKGA